MSLVRFGGPEVIHRKSLDTGCKCIYLNDSRYSQDHSTGDIHHAFTHIPVGRHHIQTAGGTVELERTRLASLRSSSSNGVGGGASTETVDPTGWFWYACMACASFVRWFVPSPRCRYCGPRIYGWFWGVGEIAACLGSVSGLERLQFPWTGEYMGFCPWCGDADHE